MSSSIVSVSTEKKQAEVLSNKSVFDQFTRKYALSKTLRFELRPVGKTRENIEKANPNFIRDKEIEDAYQILKPVFDKLHEEFITESLESDEAKHLSFEDYFSVYKNLRNEQDREEKKKIEKSLETKEKNLRAAFSDIYKAEGEKFKSKVGSDKKGKPILKEDSFKILTEVGILKYVKAKIEEFVVMNLKTHEGKEVKKEDLEKALGTADSKGVFEGFFTYLTGFNQNRENYYSTEEKATAVASRIIDENLPKFADNVLEFQKRKDEYLKVYDFLKENGIETIGKNQKGEKVELEKIIADIFEIGYFTNCLSQREIEKYNLNIGNANNLINRYNQQQSEKNKKLRIFKTLYKQIGCGEKGDFIPAIKNDDGLRAVLKNVVENGEKYFGQFDGKIEDKVDTVGEFVHYIINHESFEGIFWSDKALNTISGKYFANWFILKKALKEGGVFGGKKKDDEDIKIPQAVELKNLFEILDKTEKWKNKEDGLFKTSLFDGEGNKKGIIERAEKPSKALLGMIFADVEKMAKDFSELSPKVLSITTDFKKPEHIENIKMLLDSALYVNQIVKYWKVKDKFAVDPILAESLKAILFGDNNPTKFYDIIRNYLTKRPQEGLNKLKLNFDNSVLGGGWDVNKEPERWCLILKDGEKKYLAILTKASQKLFGEKAKYKEVVTDENYLKMDYKLLPGPNKMLPKVLLPKRNRKEFGATDDILSIYDEGGFKKNQPSFTKEKLWKIIDFYKEGLKVYPSAEKSWQDLFGFNFSPTEKFESIDQFYNEVEKQGYKLSWNIISKKLINEAVENGEIYFFEIRNKDNNLKEGKEKTSEKNLHTIYWNEIFGDVANKPKLNGEAEIFYRKTILKKKENETDKEFEIRLKEKLGKKKDKSGKEVLEHKRFANEKFVFHCPITLNFCLRSLKFNDEINESMVKLNDDITTIGIDRGEKHLAYYFVVKQTKDGKIETLDQGSFNEINGQNYAEKLEKMAGNRDEARKNWKTIGTIKELKDGYISQVVRKIVDLAIYEDVEKKVFRETPAFIVLEDLNIGFKRGRQKIEKQVYQKLELALAKKLNFLVDKHAKEGEIGSVTSALQLTPLVNNFGDIEGKKQFGIMFYTKADYTSQTDPVTGWRKTIYLKKGSEESIKKQILDNFDDIKFDGKDYYFKYTDRNTNKPWELYSGKDGESLDRYYRELVHENSDKKWVPKEQNLKKILDGLFEGFDKEKSLLEQLRQGKNPNKINDRTSWESLRFVIDLIQQIRNSGKTEEDADFILSPVRDKNGNHFDSRKINLNLPTSGDANGAYNIARKGIIMCEHIKRDLSLFISDEEWSAWLAGREIWENWIKKNEKNLKRKQ